MKRAVMVICLLFFMEACTLFRPRIPYQMGMTENKFLRQNRNAVISQLDGTKKVYRVNTDDRFYILATFEEGVLTELEERELAPVWQQQRMMEERNEQ